jgi:exodeoxyribonuclease VII small subunit
LTPPTHIGKLHLLLLSEPRRIVSKKIKDSTPSETGTPDLEKSLAELEKIVERMEAGDLSLDESLKQFERGVTLTRQCQTALRSAEQKVEILLRKSGASASPEEGYEAAPFDDDETP